MERGGQGVCRNTWRKEAKSYILQFTIRGLFVLHRLKKWTWFCKIHLHDNIIYKEDTIAVNFNIFLLICLVSQ